MEDTLITTQKNQNSIELLPEWVSYLNEAKKWSMFMAILGFIGLGFLVITALFLGTVFSFIGGESISRGLGFGISYFLLILGVVYFFPIFYLFKFSQKAKIAAEQSCSTSLVESISNLKSHYKFIGITAIVMMVVYPIMMVPLVVGGVLSQVW